MLTPAACGLEFLAPTALGSPLSWFILFFGPAADFEGPAWKYETVVWVEVLLPQLINCALLLLGPVRRLRRRPARRPSARRTPR